MAKKAPDDDPEIFDKDGKINDAEMRKLMDKFKDLPEPANDDPVKREQYDAFYDKIRGAAAAECGKLKETTTFHIIGFDMGGPINYFSTQCEDEAGCLTHVTSELAVRAAQNASAFGRFELLMTCDDEKWCSRQLTGIAAMSLESTFGHGHTVDIGAFVKRKDPLQGLLLEKFATFQFEGESYGILRCIGITRPEMEFAIENGKDRLFRALKKAGVYPRTLVKRRSVPLE
ncbi:MAG: suppressor of fused domain protein [Planctomycetes bacterium]|nr:suppressor of fused domain protein [Planctomycetota bacterium]